MAEKGKEKVTMMKLKVDLDCEKCYKKVKKVIGKIPQIRDQLFDEKSNMVVIKVVCCSPERIMDKLCSKGGGSIKTIAIIEPPKPPQPQPQPQTQPKGAEKPKDAPKAAEKPKEQEKPKEPAPKPAPAAATKQQGPPQQQGVPMMHQGQPIAMYYGGFGGEPAFRGYGMPQQPYECYGRPVHENWAGGPPPCYGHPNRYDHFSDDNSWNCSIM